MPLLEDQTYQPSLLLRNGFINTIYPFFKRDGLTSVLNQRLRWATKDGDFIDIDCLLSGKKTAILLLHGLEGSSNSQYIKASANLLSQYEHDIYAINHRSCSGELNHQVTMYHSGFTMDIHMVTQRLSDAYDEVIIIGYSMGGNMALKYAGDGRYQLPSNLSKIIAISVPMDLASSSLKLAKWYNKPFAQNFLGTLKKKMLQKAEQYPHIVNADALPYTKTLIDFDNYFTGPIHGFQDAADYYRKASAKPFLENITIQTHIISAVDDPFLTNECLPFEASKNHKYVHFLPTRYGGHVGYANLISQPYWLESKILSLTLD